MRDGPRITRGDLPDGRVRARPTRDGDEREGLVVRSRDADDPLDRDGDLWRREDGRRAEDDRFGEMREREVGRDGREALLRDGELRCTGDRAALDRDVRERFCASTGSAATMQTNSPAARTLMLLATRIFVRMCIGLSFLSGGARIPRLGHIGGYPVKDTVL